jgi:hypothetical protein
MHYRRSSLIVVFLKTCPSQRDLAHPPPTSLCGVSRPKAATAASPLDAGTSRHLRPLIHQTPLQNPSVTIQPASLHPRQEQLPETLASHGSTGFSQAQPAQQFQIQNSSIPQCAGKHGVWRASQLPAVQPLNVRLELLFAQTASTRRRREIPNTRGRICPSCIYRNTPYSVMPVIITVLLNRYRATSLVVWALAFSRVPCSPAIMSAT